MIRDTTPSDSLSIFIFDGPNSCSKLLGKVLSTHQQLESVQGYPYLLAATRGPDRTLVNVTPSTMQRLSNKWQDKTQEEDMRRWQTATFEKANDDISAGIKQIHADNRTPIVQEHAVLCMKPDLVIQCLRQPLPAGAATDLTNPTVIPEHLLSSCIPVILIRHPALSIPSFYRHQKEEDMLDLDDEAFQMWISLRWVSILYEYFSGGTDRSLPAGAVHRQSRHSSLPVVVDAEDLVHDTTALMSKLCPILGVDAREICLTWGPSTHDPIPEGVMPSFHERLRMSTGIERDEGEVLDKDIDLDDSTRRWTEEFGLDTAQAIRAKVDAEMPAYRYLHSHKL